MKRHLLLAAIVSGAAFASITQAQDRLLVQFPAVLDPGASVIDTIRRECGLESMVGDWVLESVSKKFPDSKRLDKASDAGNGKVLRVTIVHVVGAGGGAWSGPKSMTVRAELVQSGKVLAQTVKERTSGGGAFGGMKGTCSIFGRVAKTLGADVAAWLPGAMEKR